MFAIQERSSHYTYFTDEETEAKMLSNLPKVTKLGIGAGALVHLMCLSNTASLGLHHHPKAPVKSFAWDQPLESSQNKCQARDQAHTQKNMQGADRILMH